MGFLPNPTQSGIFTKVLRAVLSSQNNKVAINVLRQLLMLDDSEKIEDLVSVVKETEVHC